ncbi:hypothetical protein [Gelidibacter sp.]|uniref:hypothetical protein n=1 Tax=Gelidibacter sp. TaxID=2018083 RepID=UPI002C927DAE|nr:hypothetical protein [Gelidibacter sp.]HUH26869.1 hypothetical protein [Gelidibacter sp.]
MNTATKPIVLKYDATNLGKFKSTTHYQLTNGNLDITDLTELLNLSVDRECAKSSPTYWIQTRNDNKWQKPRLTGLFKTESQNIYKGDTQKGRTKLVFVFSDLRQTLTVYYFKDLNYPNFYKDDLSRFKAFLQNTNL